MTAASARTQLGLLLRLHFTLLRRRATATPGRRVVTALLVGLGTVASLLLGLTAFASLWVARWKSNYPPVAMDEAVHLCFAVVYGILVLSPALGFRGNEFLDVTRLFHLPVSHRTVFTASTIGTCLSGGVLFWLAPLVGVVAGSLAPKTFRGSPEFPGMDWGTFGLRMLLVLVFLFHAVAVGQVLMLLVVNSLKSRKFEDLGMVLAPVLGGAIYLGTWFLLFRGRSQVLRGGQAWTRTFLQTRPSESFPWLPSRWVTEAMETAGSGGMGAWLPFLLGLLPLTIVAMLVAARLQERAFHGLVPPPEVERGGSGRRIPGGALLRRLFPDPVLAVASKELRLLRREPIVKTVLIGQAFFLALPVLAVALRPGEADSLGTAARISWALPFLLVFVENTLTMNLLGLEGAGITHLRTTPASWRRILAGKDLCYLLAFGTLNALFSTAVLLLLAAFRPEKVPDPWTSVGLAVVGGTAALAVVLAVGNVLSVAMPTPLTARGRMALRQQASFSEGCYEKIVRTAVFGATVLLIAPIPLALHVLPAFSEWFQEGWWTAVGVLFAPAYAWVLLRRSFPMAERMGREGEEAIWERLARSGE